MRLLHTLFTVFLFISISFSQQWIKTFDGNSHGDDQIYSTVADNLGNIYVTGFSSRIGSDEDFCTIKYNSSGIIQWISYYDGPAHKDDRAFASAISNNGQYVYVTGYSKSQNYNPDITTIKYNSSDGTQIAVNRFGDPSNSDDRAFGITIDIANNVYITGYISRGGTGTDIYTVKYNPNLVSMWQNIYSGNGNSDDKSFGIVTDNSGRNVYITGYATVANNYTDMVTINYDSSGNTKWVKTYNGSKNEDDRAFGITIDSYLSGGIYITGFSTNENSGQDYTTIKYNPLNGAVKWVSNYNGTGNGIDNAFGIAVDGAGNSYITGVSAGLNQLNDFLTVKYDNGGNKLWSARYNGTGNGNDSAAALVLSADKKYLFVSGSSISGLPAGKEDIVTIKYDVLSGELIQISMISTQPNEKDVCSYVTADTSNNVFVVGYTKTMGNGSDFETIKYQNGELIGLKKISKNVPAGYSLFQNYPNPFNPGTKILFDIPNSGAKNDEVVQLKVYDVIGREVAALVNGQLKPGTYEVDWDASNFSGGVYFYKISAGSFIETKRMVLIK